MKKKMRKLVRIAVLILIAAHPASADYLSKDQLPKVGAIRVVLEDNVKDGCLPQPDLLKVEAELILRRSGIKVVEKPKGRPHTLVIEVNGFADSKYTCVGSYLLALGRLESLADKTPGIIISALLSYIAATHKNRFQQYLRENINQLTTTLSNEILKGRQR